MSTEPSPPPSRYEPQRPVDPADLGGEAVCYLPRVCPDCGRLADDEPPTRCPRCGATIGID